MKKVAIFGSTGSIATSTLKVIEENPELFRVMILVAGGKIIINAVKKYDATLITVDSEHSAIMQCLRGEEENKIDKILLTASGGPFFDKEITETITLENALNHPTWNMGKKVTIDSATMMNKGFEVIEA